MNIPELSEKAKILCSICRKEKAAIDFYKKDRRCKQCQSKIKKDKYAAAKKISKSIKSKKVCKSCNTLLQISRFPIYALSKDGHANTCWTCKNNLEKLNTNPKKYWWRKACVVNRRGNKKVTAQDLQNLFEYQNKKCIYCGITLTQELLNVDHKIPISRDGSNNINNLQIICKYCNFLKLDRTHNEFIEFLHSYVKNLSCQLEPKDDLKNQTGAEHTK